MNLRSLRLQSLKARMALSTLAVFLLSLWALAFYSSSMLRQDMVRISGKQQFTTVTALAIEIDNELSDRLEALAATASQVTPALLKNPAALKTLLAQNRLLSYLFNAGAFVLLADGSAIAEAPESGRVGLNYLDRSHIATTLQQGTPGVGRPIVGKALHAPSFSMAMPIRDLQGKVIGALVGAIDLSAPNFLDKLLQSSYGLTGGYLLVAREPQLIVSATDKSRIMQPVGKGAMAMRYLDGFEGSDVHVDSQGVEVLASVKGIPVAQWYLASTLPTAEAFAPIGDLQQRLLWATLLTSMLACGLTWWLLQRQWFPMLATVEKLAVMADENTPLVPLPIPEHTGVADLVIGVNRVLKTLELREAALLEEEAFRRAIIDSVEAEIVVLDSHGVITAVNQRWACSAAISACVAQPNTGIGSNYLAICAAAEGSEEEDSALHTAQGIRAVLEQRLPRFTMEYACHAPDAQRWFMLVVTPLNLPGGGVVVAHNHITARKLAEDLRVRSEERLCRMQAGANDAFWDLDLVNRQMFYSRRWWTMLGYVGEQASTDPLLWQGLLHPDDAPRVQQVFAALLLSDAASGVVEFRLLHQDGYYLSVECRGVIARDPSGLALRISGANTDLTERKLAEADLLAAKAEAEMANHAKSRFLAAASHDLRQPLAAMALYTRVLESAVKPGQEKLVSAIECCVDNLNALLTDLLDVSRLDAGGVVPAVSDFLADDLCASLRAIHEVRAAKKGLQLRCRYAASITLRTDRQIFSRLVGNLIDNAVKYTDHGGVLLATRRHGGRLWVEVWDTGTGIAKGQLPGIFEEFRQLGDGAHQRGSGLGLAIVAKSAALLGLEIRVASRPGRGSMFAIELPQDLAPAIDRLASPAASPLLTIALVDDHGYTLKALVLVLQSLGHTVIAAASGAALLDQLGQRVPDIVVCDLRLAAGETALDVIDAVRGRFGAGLAAIILTGDTQAEPLHHIKGIAVCCKSAPVTRLQACLQQAVQAAR